MSDDSELIAIAEILEADGDEWNVANSLRRIASKSNPEPTHYAVMAGDHIIHAVPADGLEPGKARCERFIESVGQDLPIAEGWTIRGVTVHD